MWRGGFDQPWFSALWWAEKGDVFPVGSLKCSLHVIVSEPKWSTRHSPGIGCSRRWTAINVADSQTGPPASAQCHWLIGGSGHGANSVIILGVCFTMVFCDPLHWLDAKCALQLCEWFGKDSSTSTLSVD